MSLFAILAFTTIGVTILTFLGANFKRIYENKPTIGEYLLGRREGDNIPLSKLEQAKVDLQIRTIAIHLNDTAGLVSKDKYIADVQAIFYLKVNNTPIDIQKAYETMGKKNINSEEYVTKYFKPKFTEALRKAAVHFTFEELQSINDQFKIKVLEKVPLDLDGFVMDDLIVNYLAGTVKKLKI